MRPSLRSRRRSAPRQRFRNLVLEQLEVRAMLASGVIELGPSDNIALDQPRVAMELIEDVDPGPGVQWESVGPSIFNTFLLDTGANSVLAMATAVNDMKGPPIAYQTQGQFVEKGVAGDHPMDISIPYRFDFAGTSGIRHTLLDAPILSDANNDFSIFGPWGLVGMPAMVNRVTSFDMTGWSGGGTGLEDLYMKVAFADDVPADTGHRYALSVDNRLSFDVADQVVSGQPPIWADVPFLTAVPTHHGVGQEGNFLFDTGAQISVISEHLAIDIGLDSNDDGKLDENDDSFVTRQEVGGVGGTVNAPVFAIDEVHVPVKQVSTGDDVEFVWTDLQWLVLDIETGPNQPSLDGVFGSDLVTSGWFHAFFYPGQPDGFVDQVHLDFRDMDNGSGTVYFDLNADVDKVIVPGPGIRLRQTARSTDVAEGGVTDTYSVVLTSQPTANVTVQLGNTDGQVTARNDADQTTTLVFTTTDWSTPQVVRVTAVDDAVAEGPHTGVVTHAVASGDGRYDQMAVPDISVNVVDDDLSLLTFTESGGSTVVTEGGTGDSYTVGLNWVPTSDVYVQFDYDATQVIAVSQRNSDPSDLFHNVLIFTSSDYAPQTVLVTAKDDSLGEGPHDTRIVHTVIDAADPLNPQILGESVATVGIVDNDLGSVSITETNGTTNVSESGGTDTYQIALATVPAGDVQITVAADSQTQVSVDGTSFFASRVLTFNSTDPQTITVRAVDDDVAESNHAGKISHAVTGTVVDSMYPTTLAIRDVTAAISDNDSAGLRITADSQEQNLITSVNVAEGGAEATYWVALDSQPIANVTLLLANSDGQATVVDDDPDSTLEFTPTNWNTPQRVHVNAVDDEVVEAAYQGNITHQAVSGDLNYQGSVLLQLSVTDNDTPPTPTISGPASPTSSDPFDVIIDFGETVTGFVQADITVGNGSVTNLTDNGNGKFSATIDPTAEGKVTVDVAAGVAQDLAGNANAAATQFSVIYAADQDQDGVSNGVEDGAPNGGDGNNDGTKDSQQKNVASFPNSADGTYVTLVVPDGMTLVDVASTGNPSPGDAPNGVDFPIGFFDFSVSGVAVGGSVVVTLYPESPVVVNTYCKHGPTPDNPTDHWYTFMFDGETGAKVFANRIELHFVDGKRGDDDLAANGTIVDPGAPGGGDFLWQNPALPEDVDGSGLVTSFDVLLLVSDINAHSGHRLLPKKLGASDVLPYYPDVHPDYELAPQDILTVIRYVNAQANGGGEGESPGQAAGLAPSGSLVDGPAQSIQIATLRRSELTAIESSHHQTVTVVAIDDPEPPSPRVSEARVRPAVSVAVLRDAYRRADEDATPRSSANDPGSVSLGDDPMESVLEAIVPDVHLNWRTD